MAREAEEQEEQETETKAGASTMKIVIVAVVLAVLLSGGLVGATMYFLNDSDSPTTENAETNENEDDEDDEEVVEEKPAEPPQYHSIGQKFVVSFRDQRSARFMQFDVEVMVRDKTVIDLIETHSPAVRSNLLMMFDNQNYDRMTTREGKNQLLIDITADINSTLLSIVGEDELESDVEASYFTAFVIQ